MASRYQAFPGEARFVQGSLGDPGLAIASPRADMYAFWGSPVLVAALLLAVTGLVARLPGSLQGPAMIGLFAAANIVTFAHLIAVVPRAYFNRDVRRAHFNRVMIVPVVLLAALLASPPLLVCAVVVAFFWDVHHSAMQTFGLSRIYDLKAGNDSHELRRTDLRLNWALYVGPIAAGASLAAHVGKLGLLGELHWTALATAPGIILGHSSEIRLLALAAWVLFVGWAAHDYHRAIRGGYRIPAPKLALLASTGLTSILMWGFAPPLIAFAAVNLFHTVQYFALVWLKEGGRMREMIGAAAPASPRLAFGVFFGLCLLFGAAYFLVQNDSLLVAPFIVCSLMHFWFDSFIWSVRKKQV
ncbi:MAG TPA: hypothetical protein VFS49_08160 [Croceibacterium sp.]|nr:hypothetical protein [Croceibacterium sp.]